MFILFLTLTLLTLCVLVIGSAMAGHLNAEKVIHCPEDMAICSIWLGIVILANCYFAFSLFVPLSPVATFGLTTFLTALAFLSPYPRRLLKQLSESITLSTCLGVSATCLGVAAYCSQVIVWYDSGLYHLQYIKWLSDAGIVPGMALIHWRLGISSSWFALPAPFNHGVLAGRMFSLGGAFCLQMLLLSAGIALHHLCRRQVRRHDLFMLYAALLVIPLVLLWGMPNSPTPDLPVITLEIVTAWLLIAITDKPDTTARSTILTTDLMPLILAAGAMSMKLSAAPLLAVAGLFYLCHRGCTPGKVLTASGITATILAPLAAAGLLISGCALFPSSLFCADVPWALGRAAVAEKSQVIQEWAKWGGAPTPAGATSWNWLIPWLRAEKVGSALILVSLVSTANFVYRTRKGESSKGIVPVTAIGLAGTAFMLCTAPSWRFGLGFLVVIPALALALYAERIPMTVFTSPKLRLLHSPALLGTLVAAVIALHGHLLPRPSYKLLDGYFSTSSGTGGDNPHFNMFLPPKAQNICNEIDSATGQTYAMTGNRILTKNAVDFTYYQPETSQTCWDAPLPCSAGMTEDPPVTVALRDRNLGISGGFIRTDAIR